MKLIKLWEADAEKAFDLYNTFEESENGFINNAFGMSFQEFAIFVQERKEFSMLTEVPNGRVPDTIYILSDNGTYVGIFKLRHYLNDFLRDGSGHIGFGISKIFRRMGYATKGLALLLDEAKAIVPEDEFYFSANKDNTASLKAQLNNGAYIHHEDEHKYYTRIKKQ